MIKKTFQIIFNSESMMKKYLKISFENYRMKKKRLLLKDTFLRKYLDILKKSQKILN